MKRLALALFLLSSPAFSFPENIRLGYTGCQSCHVSPTGGGVLTSYGRGASAEFMTSWGKETEGRFLHGLVKKQIDFLDLGGDVRYIKVNYETEGAEPFARQFKMQADLELAVHLSEEVSVVASYGEYGEQAVREYRRHYLLWNKGPNFSFRFGRFFPAYSIMTTDHTLKVKEHLDFGQGRESYNAEASIKGEKGELFLTAIFGKEGNVRLTRDQGYLVSSQEKGAAARASIFFSDRALAGVSVMALQNETNGTTQAFGAFGSVGFTRTFYALVQYDIKSTRENDYSQPDSTSAGWGKLGWQFLRGVHAYSQIEFLSDKVDSTVFTGGGIQWFPRPHFELLAQYMSGGTSKETYLMAHYYW